jgi:endonuclease/exonuclease/phosphatase family metal-dependent hydrolase
MSVAMFVRHGLTVREYGARTILWPDDIQESGSFIISPRKMQYAVVGTGNGPSLTVANYHGMWRSTGKRDTPERIEEMKTLAAEMKTLGRPLVLMGDFNLDPDTRAIAGLMRSAKLRTYMPAIEGGTRTPLFRHWGDSAYSSFADFAFWTKDLVDTQLTILADVASDHAPLLVHLEETT